jgi:hypothetical protein
MIGGLRNFTAKEDREAGTELRLVAPTTLARCRPAAVGLVAQSRGAGRRKQPTPITRKPRGSLNVRFAPKATELLRHPATSRTFR